jgi:hypothetical protein
MSGQVSGRGPNAIYRPGLVEAAAEGRLHCAADRLPLLVGLVSTDDLIAEVAREVGALAGLLRRQPAEEGHQYAEL